MELPDGSKITILFLDQYIYTIIEAFSGYQWNVRVLLWGMGKYNRTGKNV